LPLAAIAAGALAMPLFLFDGHYADAITPLYDYSLLRHAFRHDYATLIIAAIAAAAADAAPLLAYAATLRFHYCAHYFTPIDFRQRH
jgi:hypothetical protein